MIISGNRRIPLVHSNPKEKDQQYFKYIPQSLRIIKLGCECQILPLEKITVGVGHGTNSIFYSQDNGLTWTGLGTLIFSTGYGIASNNSIWVAVGQGTNSLAYSKDGKNWVGLGNSIISGGRSVLWNGSLWVVGGSNGIAYSSDGINWTTVALNIQVHSLAWNGSLWVAGGSSSVGNNGVAYSSDLINWTYPTVSSQLQDVLDIVYYNSRFIAMCNTSGNLFTKMYSSDGITWTTIAPVAYNTGNAIEKFNSSYFSVGTGAGAGNTAETSNDGINWIKATDATFIATANNTTSSGRGVFFFCNQKLFLCAITQLGYTSDGVNWSSYAFPLSGSYIRAAYSLS